MAKIVCYKIGEISEPISDTSTLTLVPSIANNEGIQEVYNNVLQELVTKDYIDSTYSDDLYNILLTCLAQFDKNEILTTLEKQQFPIDFEVKLSNEGQPYGGIGEFKGDFQNNGVYIAYIEEPELSMEWPYGYFPFIFRFPFLSSGNEIGENSINYGRIRFPGVPQ